MKDNIILHIDSTSPETKLSLYIDGAVKDTILVEGANLTDNLLLKIEELLKKNHFSRNDLRAISVNPGPGPYTALRVAIATANSIAYALNIPIAEKLNKTICDNYSSPIMPKYGNLPNITKPRTRLKQ